MSYIGQGLPTDTFSGFTTDSFSGDGSATTFTLSKAPFSEDGLIVVINNVIQQPTTNFTVSGTTLTIVGTAVATGNTIYAIHTSGAVPSTLASKVDVNGLSDGVVLDADADTTISADTDDQIDFKAGGTDIMSLTATTATINDNTTITTDDNTDTLSLISTDDDANVGPVLRLYRNSASAVDNDVIGNIIFSGNDTGGNETDYLTFQVNAGDADDGQEDGFMRILMPVASTSTEFVRLSPAEVVFNEGGADLDFRVEGNNYANNLKVDAGSDVVLMGDGSDYASSQLQVTWADGRADSTAIAFFKNEKNSGTLFGITVQFRNTAPDNQTSILQSWQDSSAIRARCFADGDFQNHDNAYGSLSDERIKQDIRDSNSQWDDIKALKVRNFKKKDDIRQYGDNAWEQIGVIAQELEDAGMDKLVRHSDPTEADIASDSSFGTIDEDGNITVKEQVKGVNYSVLYMKAIKALQEAMAKIETLETKVQALEDA